MTDTLIPTRERLTKSNTWDTPASDRTAKRLTHRAVGVVEAMKRRGWLTDAQGQAFEIYERSYLAASRTPGTTIRYGEAARGGNSELDPIDRRVIAANKIDEFDRMIAYPNGALALRMCATEDTCLENIGRTLCGEGNKTAAIAAAKQLIQIALYRLAHGMSLLQHFHRSDP